MLQNGLFDLDKRIQKIDSNGDPLSRIYQTVAWEIFRQIFEEVRKKPQESAAGPKNRVSFFQPFLGPHIGSKVPDATTIWCFREDIIKGYFV